MEMYLLRRLWKREIEVCSVDRFNKRAFLVCLRVGNIFMHFIRKSDKNNEVKILTKYKKSGNYDERDLEVPPALLRGCYRYATGILRDGLII